MDATVPKALIVATLNALLAVVVACGDDPASTQDDEPLTETRTVRDIDFVEDRYFFFDRTPDAAYPANFFLVEERSVEIWQTVPDHRAEEENAKRGVAFVDTTGRGFDLPPRDSVLGGAALPPNEDRQFKLLAQAADYRFVEDPRTEDVVGIELLSPVPQGEALAVRYINVIGDTIGDIGNETEPIILELVKAAYPLPDGPFGFTWPFMMRHFYDLGMSNIDGSSFNVDILEHAGDLDPSRPEGSSVPWLRIFGLDRTDQTGIGPPDGEIDLSTGNVDLQRGILMFPIPTPFAPPDDSVAAWTDGEFAFTGQYEDIRRPKIYTDFLTRPDEYSRFTIRAERVIGSMPSRRLY